MTEGDKDVGFQIEFDMRTKTPEDHLRVAEARARDEAAKRDAEAKAARTLARNPELEALAEQFAATMAGTDTTPVIAARSVVREVKERPGGFLRRERQSWRQIDDYIEIGRCWIIYYYPILSYELVERPDRFENVHKRSDVVAITCDGHWIVGSMEPNSNRVQGLRPTGGPDPSSLPKALASAMGYKSTQDSDEWTQSLVTRLADEMMKVMKRAGRDRH